MNHLKSFQLTKSFASPEMDSALKANISSQKFAHFPLMALNVITYWNFPPFLVEASAFLLFVNILCRKFAYLLLSFNVKTNIILRSNRIFPAHPFFWGQPWDRDTTRRTSIQNMSETTINISIFGGKCFIFLSGEVGWWKRRESKLELDEKRACKII